MSRAPTPVAATLPPRGQAVAPVPHEAARFATPWPASSNLRMTQPGDAHETQADALARQALTGAPGSPGARTPVSALGPRPDGRLQGLIAAAAAEARPMDDEERVFFEPRFGHRLDRIRLHAGPAAARAASAARAQAFTLGHDIYFGEGAHRPHSPGGRRLLAHELAHAVQGQPNLLARRALSDPFDLGDDRMPASLASGNRAHVDERASALGVDDPSASDPLVDRLGRLPSAARYATIALLRARLPASRRGELDALAGAVRRAAPRDPSAPQPANDVRTEPAANRPNAQPLVPPAGAPVAPPTLSGPAPATLTPSVPEPGRDAAGELDEQVSQPVAETAEPIAKTPPTPRQAIASTVGAVHQRAGHAAGHPDAAVPAAKAESAGTDPNLASARAAGVDTVENVQAAAQTSEDAAPSFRKKLGESLSRAIASSMQQPKTKDEADALIKEGAGHANQSLGTALAAGRQAATGPMQQTIDHPVQPQTGATTPVLQPQTAGPAPLPIPASQAIPAPIPPKQLDASLDMSADRGPTEQAMAENGISNEQLQDGNEPAFGPALSARTDAEQHETGVQAQFRASESAERTSAEAAAAQALAAGLAGMHAARGTQLGEVGKQQTGSKDKNLAAKKAATTHIVAIRDQTLLKVGQTLDGLEDNATRLFEAGLRRAEDVYDDAFKDAKGGTWTWLTTWGDDWSEHVESALRDAKSAYRREVDRAIDEVADFVEGRLTEAKRCVAAGLRELQVFVNGLDGEVREYAEAAVRDIAGEFEQMTADIDRRADGLIDTLTGQFRASGERIDAAEEKLRDENKSLWQRVYDATVGLIKKIVAFKDMLLDMLGRAASVIGDIVQHPIRFLGNLIGAVKTGISNFVTNIGRHLKQGLLDWLFGAVAEAGITLPDSFDLRGVASLVLQVLGITYANFRARAVSLLGEKVVGGIEKTAEVFRRIAVEGPVALWDWIREKLGDLKSMVLDQIQNFIVTKVITAGVTWLIGLLNPASAFFKACKAIYDIVTFFVERGSQIATLVNAIIDSVAAIAAGAIDNAAAMVENAMARAIPVIIGFLAALLGIGGLTEKIKSVIATIRRPVDTAIDWVIGKASALVSRAGQAVSGFAKRDSRAEHPDDPRKQARLDAGVHALATATQHAENNGRIDEEHAQKVAAEVHRAHPVFQSITVIDAGDRWDYDYRASRNRVSGAKKAAQGDLSQGEAEYASFVAFLRKQQRSEGLSLNVGQDRARRIASGKEDFALDTPLSVDVDEPNAIGERNKKGQRLPKHIAIARALDPHNRQFAESMHNRRTKHARISPQEVARSQVYLPPVTIDPTAKVGRGKLKIAHPSVVFERRFDEVKELHDVFKEAVRRIKNPRSLPPGKLKEEINKNIREIIKSALSPSGKIVRDALHNIGFEFREGGLVAMKVAHPEKKSPSR